MLVLDGRVIEVLDASGAASGRWHVEHVAVATAPAEDGALLEIAPQPAGAPRVTLGVPAARASAALAFAEAVRRVRAMPRRRRG